MPKTDALTQSEAQGIVAQVLAMHAGRAEERGDVEEATRLLSLAVAWAISSIFCEEEP